MLDKMDSSAYVLVLKDITWTNGFIPPVVLPAGWRGWVVRDRPDFAHAKLVGGGQFAICEYALNSEYLQELPAPKGL